MQDLKTPNRISQNNQHLKFADPENMKVIIRLRPTLGNLTSLNTSDRLPTRNKLSHDDQSNDGPFTIETEESSILAGGTWYTFDGVHTPTSTTEEIYEKHMRSMIKDSVEGYNATLFAYGATGSGKSYSMIGNDKDLGIVPRSIEDVFDLIEQDCEREYVIRVSYLEIYNEQLRDLLTDETTIPKIHEDRQGRIFVRPLTSIPCGDPIDVMNLLSFGESKRKVKSTEWNLNSSRSHTIFSLTIESRPIIIHSGFPITSSSLRDLTDNHSIERITPEPIIQDDHHVFLGTGQFPITPSLAKFKQVPKSSKSPDGSIRISHLNLVDLAGSEKLTDNEERNKEAGYIKKSLLALQTVVSSLTELSNSTTSKQRLMHIPYRNSQLTRLLQTSLSGNAKVCFLCTISNDLDCEIESLSTIRFASGAKKVITKPELGQVVDRTTLLHALETKVFELELALLTNADYTEALERERDEAIERADGAAKICDDYEAKLAELETLRTPLKEQHDHLRRLILTGSPHSSYAQNTENQSPTNTTSLIHHRRKSTIKRPSRISEIPPITSPTNNKIGWKELLFDDSQTAIAHTKGQKEEISHEPTSSDDLNELQLTIAKLEATLTESEETHAGEILELKSETDNLNKTIDELEIKLKQKEESENQKLIELEENHLKEIIKYQERMKEMEKQILELQEKKLIINENDLLKPLKNNQERCEPRCSDITIDGDEIIEEEEEEEEEEERVDKIKKKNLSPKKKKINDNVQQEVNVNGPIRRSTRVKK
ncbi:hypothetical protein CROQUDRAFT_717106 [Cronartium quercuum f. sp. fusiforme G11]|uniref:Kinesin-like protein n=1 Tax=Cronartium quercuum f. sp. fusiforme G11 TaxID=708437 RepID=A0A9P6T8Z7_9BASI|nr:hypothetical protein CROQUDRAFT_717106 [Cronartium quercuum f. sp. fusiforme G11]